MLSELHVDSSVVESSLQPDEDTVVVSTTVSWSFVKGSFTALSSQETVLRIVVRLLTMPFGSQARSMGQAG